MSNSETSPIAHFLLNASRIAYKLVWGALMENVYKNFVTDFNNKIYSLETRFSDYIFLCIGTDRITGDAFGPLVGKRLKELLKDNYNNVFIKGCLDEPISFLNIDTEIENIYNTYKTPCVIAVDSALARQEDIGKIIVSNEKMELGKGLSKKYSAVGDISIKGVVAKNFKIPRQNLNVLQNTSLKLVMDLAEITANGIYKVIAINR